MTNQAQSNQLSLKKESVPAEPRRYLVNIDSISTNQLFTDCLVVGAGIAGLRAAIEAADSQSGRGCNVILVCKGTIHDSNTWHAQGGIASVLDKEDCFESHITDTLATGCGISNKKVTELVVRQGPELIEQLIQWGADFDLIDGHIAMTLEGGHSHARIAHAHGDETGRIIADTLIKKVRENPNIKIIENFYAIDLITNDDNQSISPCRTKSSR